MIIVNFAFVKIGYRICFNFNFYLNNINQQELIDLKLIRFIRLFISLVFSIINCRENFSRSIRRAKLKQCF